MHIIKRFHLFLAIIFAFSLMGARGQSPSYSAGAVMNSSALLQTACLDSGRGRSAVDSHKGVTQFVSTRAGVPVRVDPALKGGSAEDVARAYLSQCGSFFGVQDQSTDLAVTRERQTFDGQRETVRFQQQYKGIPVVAGELFMQLDANRDILAVGGNVLPKVFVDTDATIDAGTAQGLAAQSVAKEYSLDASDLSTSDPVLKIYNPVLLEGWSGPTSLVWEMTVDSASRLDVRQYVLVDAHHSGVILSFNQVDEALAREVYDGTTSSANGNGVITSPGTLKCNESTNTFCDDFSTDDSDYTEAFQYAAATYNYYNTHFGRDSYNNVGSTIKLITKAPPKDSTFCNAFWNGTYIVIDSRCTHNGSDDTIGHELTHAVTGSEAKLFYYYQSGAINESMSDVFGEFIDWSTNPAGALNDDSAGVRWELFEDVAPGDVNNQGPLRNMKDPTIVLHGQQQPDKMTSPFYQTTSSDYGGVHTNSGVGNKAAYLITDGTSAEPGGTFNGYTITGIGEPKAAAIYYETLTNLLVSGSDYRDLHDALVQACENLVNTTPAGAGSVISTSDCDDVQSAVDAVEMDQEPVTGFNSEAPVCDNPSDMALNLFADGDETATYNINYAGVNDTPNATDYQHWYDSNIYAGQGLWSFYGDDYDYDGGNAVSDTYIAMRPRTYLPASFTNAYLRFEHAFGFENSLGNYYDGGVVEYSTNGGSTWNDVNTLGFYDTNTDYNGTVQTGFGNPLSGRSAFVGLSHGYISSRVNLTSLLGQSVLFRWRMGTDSTGYDYGWWVDNIQIYTCVSSMPTMYTSTFKSTGTQDGWVLESSETTNKGGLMSNLGKLLVGDNLFDQQYRTVLSFNTAGLPDTAVVLSAKLGIKKYSLVGGGNIFSLLGDLLVDARATKFGTSPNLEISDFQAGASLNNVSPFSPYLKNGWYYADVGGAGSFISRTGTTQYRLHFKKDDNDNLKNNYLSLYGGETVSNAPTLTVIYIIP